MTSRNPNHEDTKLILIVAGLVVVGAVGIALVAGLNADPETSPIATAPSSSTSKGVSEATPMPPVLTAEPAMSKPVEASTPPLDKPDVALSETVSEALAQKTEGTVTESMDLVASGLEAYRSRDYATAVDCFVARTEGGSNDAWTHYMLGLSQWKAGQLDDAAASLRVAAERDPDGIRCRINLSRVENDRGEFDAALAAAEEAIAIDVSDGESWFLKGRSLRNLEQLEDARDALDHSVVLDPENGYAWNLLGLVLIDLERFDIAAERLEQAATLLPEVAYVHNNLGMALENIGERDAARVAYAKAVELNPSHASASQHLARLGGPLPVDAIAEQAGTDGTDNAEDVSDIDDSAESETTDTVVTVAATEGDADSDD